MLESLGTTHKVPLNPMIHFSFMNYHSVGRAIPRLLNFRVFLYLHVLYILTDYFYTSQSQRPLLSLTPQPGQSALTHTCCRIVWTL